MRGNEDGSTSLGYRKSEEEADRVVAALQAESELAFAIKNMVDEIQSTWDWTVIPKYDPFPITEYLSWQGHYAEFCGFWHWVEDVATSVVKKEVMDKLGITVEVDDYNGDWFYVEPCKENLKIESVGKNEQIQRVLRSLSERKNT